MSEYQNQFNVCLSNSNANYTNASSSYFPSSTSGGVMQETQVSYMSGGSNRSPSAGASSNDSDSDNNCDRPSHQPTVVSYASMTGSYNNNNNNNNNIHQQQQQPVGVPLAQQHHTGSTSTHTSSGNTSAVHHPLHGGGTPQQYHHPQHHHHQHHHHQHNQNQLIDPSTISKGKKNAYPRATFDDGVTRAAPFFTIELVNHHGSYQPFCLVPLHSLTQNQTQLVQAVRHAATGSEFTAEDFAKPARREPVLATAVQAAALKQHAMRKKEQQQQQQQQQGGAFASQMQQQQQPPQFVPQQQFHQQQQQQQFPHQVQPSQVVVMNGQHYLVQFAPDGTQQLIPISTISTPQTNTVGNGMMMMQRQHHQHNHQQQQQQVLVHQQQIIQHNHHHHHQQQHPHHQRQHNEALIVQQLMQQDGNAAPGGETQLEQERERDRKKAHGIDYRRFKTRLCVSYQSTRTCIWGPLCAFAHGLDEVCTPAQGKEIMSHKLTDDDVI